MMRLTTIALVVSDAKKSAKWYAEKLGFEIRDHQGHWITVAPKNENVAFHLCEGYYPLEPGNSGISFVSKDVRRRSRHFGKRGSTSPRRPRAKIGEPTRCSRIPTGTSSTSSRTEARERGRRQLLQSRQALADEPRRPEGDGHDRYHGVHARGRGQDAPIPDP